MAWGTWPGWGRCGRALIWPGAALAGGDQLPAYGD